MTNIIAHSRLTESVVRYLADGHRLLALSGKRPHPKYHREWSWENSIRGLPQEPEHLTALYGCFDDPTVTGVAILIPENVLVADIDTEDAAELFMGVVGEGPKDTAIGRTPNGLHVWYLAPGESASRWLGGRTLLFKGFGGYVAVEPSRHFDADGSEDGTYRWVSDISDGIDWLPEPIANMLRTARELESMMPRHEEADMTRIELQFSPEGAWQGMYPTWDMDGLAKAVTDAPDGNQNNVIFWATCVARDGGVPYEVTKDVLLAAALAGHHPRDRALSTIRGAYKRRRG